MSHSLFSTFHFRLSLGVLCLTCLAGLFLPPMPRAQASGNNPVFAQIKKLTATDGAPSDDFFAVAISGDTVIVGASGNNSGTGAAYIFDRNQGGLDNWGLVKKLTANDATMGDAFGAAVGISGDTIVVGAYQNNSHRGAAYVFERNLGGANNWGQVKKIIASDAADPDFFASALTIDGDTVVIGAYHKQFFTGAAYIFDRNQGGTGNWGQVKKLTASDAANNDSFGSSVSISGDTVAIGAIGKNENTGAAYIFGRNQGGANNWGESKKLTISDGLPQDVFGASIGISNDTVVVGASGKNATTGAAYVFDRNQGGANNWGQVRMLTANDGIAPDRFGVSVGIAGDTVVVGADQNYGNAGQTFRGAAYLFGRNQGGTGNWGQMQKLTANDEADYDYFGLSVALSGDSTNGYKVLVGALFANDQAGAAYLFSNSCTTPSLTPASLPLAQVGTPYSQTITASPGGSYTFAVTAGALPNGLTLNAATGQLSGTPSQLGLFNFRLTATSILGCSNSLDYALNVATCTMITVNPATPTNGTVGTAYSQTISATPALAYGFSLTSGALPNGLSLDAMTGVISGTPTTAGTFAFRITAGTGGCSGYRDCAVTITCPTVTLTPTLPNASAGVYYTQTISAAPGSGYSFSLASGSLPSGLALNAQTGVLSGFAFAPGASNFTVKAQTAVGCAGQQVYTVTVACPAITLAALPTPTLNTAYTQSVAAAPSGGAYTYSATAGALPNGLSLNAATGVVSGTPTLAGTFNFTLTATSFGTCAGNRAYSFTISGNACPTIALPALPNGNLGQMYSNTVAATPVGGYSYSLSGTLPPGVTFYNAAGLLFGFPMAAGTYNFSITATDTNNCAASRSYAVTVAP
ncbi:MAG: putative Ig domain-containing protein [Acidobacteria bacterium]|nr:putative Ig domain-containing protein [Acidobacteriota bacterium]MBI3424580.1 putative Ig domain-containing protein [Acidobacteriota bacterium]